MTSPVALLVLLGVVSGIAYGTQSLVRHGYWTWPIAVTLALAVLAYDLWNPRVTILVSSSGGWSALGDAILLVAFVLPALAALILGLLLGGLARIAARD